MLEKQRHYIDKGNSCARVARSEPRKLSSHLTSLASSIARTDHGEPGETSLLLIEP